MTTVDVDVDVEERDLILSLCLVAVMYVLCAWIHEGVLSVEWLGQ